MTLAPPRGPCAWAFHLDLYAARLPGRPAGPVAPPDPAAHGCSLTRAALDRLGPYDASLRVSEDTDAAIRLAALGVPMWFEPRVRTAHRAPTTTRALLSERARRGGTAARGPRAAPRAVSAARAVVAVPALWCRELGRTVRTAWRYGAGDRTHLLVALPWLVAGRTAGLVGSARERRRAARA